MLWFKQEFLFIFLFFLHQEGATNEMGNMMVQARIFIYTFLFFLQQEGATEDMYKLFEK